MQTEIVGQHRNGKTNQLLALYHSFDQQDLNPVFLFSKKDMALDFSNNYAVNASHYRQLPRLNSHKAFIIDGIESFPPDLHGEGDVLALVRKRLQIQQGVRVIVYARIAEPGKTGC